MRLALFATSLATLSLMACVRVALEPGAETVRVTASQDAVKGCKSLGLVKGADRLQGGIIGQGAAEDNAMTRIRNHAHQMGANTVLMITSRAGMSGSSAQGEAFSCPTP
jgi:uncharacterized protein YbjQ (UPF0145 family)